MSLATQLKIKTTVFVDRSKYKKVQKICKEQDITYSQLIRSMLDERIKEYECVRRNSKDL